MVKTGARTKKEVAYLDNKLKLVTEVVKLVTAITSFLATLLKLLEGF